MANRIAFAKIGWSDFYEGGLTRGRAAYLRTYKGHECYNFKPAPDGRYYGCVGPLGRGRAPNPSDKTGWLVVFVAPRDGSGPLTAVGWYENANFAGSFRPRPEYEQLEIFDLDDTKKQWEYCFSCEQAFRIPVEQRTVTIPGTHFRRASILYAKGGGRNEPWRMALAELAESLVEKFAPHTLSSAEEADVGGFPVGAEELRKKVEKAAIRTACIHLKKQGYKVQDRQRDHCGYDLLALRKEDLSELHVEVKGTSLADERFFISRTEKMYMSNAKWRLALVTDALDKPKLRILDTHQVEKEFNFEPMSWMVGIKRS